MLVVEAPVSTKVEAAASCGLPEEGIAAAVGTEADTGSEQACESKQQLEVAAFAGSLRLVAGRLVPSRPCSDGEGLPTSGCWRWTRNEDARPSERQVPACQAACHRIQALGCVVLGPRTHSPPHSHPIPWCSCSRDASS